MTRFLISMIGPFLICTTTYSSIKVLELETWQQKVWLMLAILFAFTVGYVDATVRDIYRRF